MAVAYVDSPDTPLSAGDISSWSERLRMGMPELDVLPPSALVEIAGSLASLRRSAELALVAVTRAAEGSGAVTASQASGPATWVEQAARKAGAPLDDARQVGSLAVAVSSPDNGPVADALLTGTVSLRGATQAIRDADEVTRLAPSADRATVLDQMLSVAGESRMTRQRTMQRLITREAAHASNLKAEEQARLESLVIRRSSTGLTVFELTLADHNAALLKAAIDQLARPVTSSDPATGELIPDPRRLELRRANALVECVRRAAAHEDEGTPLSNTMRLVVTVTAKDLADGLGLGASLGQSQTITAGQLRRMACEAGIIPVVLGSASEVLDLGREARFFSRAQRGAMTVRDGGCTFPGCDRPPGQCRAHHIRPFELGGHTDMASGALLCSFHHHVVHRDNLTAQVTPEGVVWDVRPQPDPQAMGAHLPRSAPVPTTRTPAQQARPRANQRQEPGVPDSPYPADAAHGRRRAPFANTSRRRPDGRLSYDYAPGPGVPPAADS